MAANQHTQTRPKDRAFLHPAPGAFPVALKRSRSLPAEVSHG